MSRVYVTFPDPLLATLAILRATGPTANYGTKAPDEFPDAEVPAFPWVSVTTDNATSTYPATETVVLRLRVWTDETSAGYQLAQQVRASLLSYPGGAEVRSFLPGIGVTSAFDPDDGKPMSVCTVVARLIPN